MAKGIAQRRRVKRALEAARGNLHKIANGKALPTALPEAPKPEKLPASLRKMLALKEVAAMKDAKGRKAENSAATPEAPAAKGKKHTKASKGGQGAADEGPSTSGRDAAGTTQKQQQQQDGQKCGQKGGAAVKGANAFTEQFVQKTLKDNKKEYLKRKAEKKRHKPGQVVVEKELQLKDQVKFGEVVHAPLQVHLKRKHWVEKEKTANERCKEIFLKQMQQAQQRMAGGAAGGAVTDEGIAVRRGAKGGSAGNDAAQKNRKRKAPMDEETEELRQRVIESYRAAKKDGGFHNAAVGRATMSSLSHLVGRGGGAKAAAGKGGNTHTLA